MKRTIRTGPKRRRWRRRDWSGSGGYGQTRRWGSTIGNFKAERESRRAGLTGKITKHDPLRLDEEAENLALPSRVRASAEREAGSD
jgi:hypothetical protein